MRIDAHQHFWDFDRFSYPWMDGDPNQRLLRNFFPAHLAPKFQRHHFDGSVTVQATTDPGEVEWLLDLADEHAYLLGVVGWVDLTDPALGHTLDRLQRRPKFKGVRHPIHDEPDDAWLLRPEVISGLKELARRGIPFDLLVRTEHLPHVERMLRCVSELRVVIDHLAKPRIASGEMEPWATEISRIAQNPRVYAKLSGMITEAAVPWRSDQLRPYVVHAMKVFGPDRLMFGSDWPVCLVAGTWKDTLAAFTQALGPLPQAIREVLLGQTAQQFYGIAASTKQEIASIG